MRTAAQGQEPALFFSSREEFRAWLEQNHATAAELWVGLYKKGAARTGLTYVEAVEEALCFGWIDGLTRGRDEDCYVQRFTPRRRNSNWSESNLRRVASLIAKGRMRPAGLAAYEARAKEGAAR